MVSPSLATTAPCDCGASLPVSKDRVLSVPVTGPETEMASAIRELLSERVVVPDGPLRRGQFPVVGVPGHEPRGLGNWQLTRPRSGGAVVLRLCCCVVSG